MTEGGDLDKLGRGTVWRGELDGCLHQNHVFALRVNPERLDARYLAWVTQSAYGRRYFESTGVKTTNLASTNSSKILDFRIPLPELGEQRRISDFLDVETGRIDRLVDLRRSMLARLDERDKAVRDSFVDRLAGKEGEISLRRFTAIIEQGASPQCEAVSRGHADEWAVLKLSAIKRGLFDPEENKRLPADAAPTRAYEVRAGDLLVTRANTPKLVGDAAIASGKCERLLLPDLIYRVRLGCGVLPSFVAQVALSGRVRAAIESAARGTSQSMVKLRGEDIKAWLVPQATVAQQRELVQVIAQATAASGRLRASIVRQLALFGERRQALITAAVTGQLDVTTARPTHDHGL